MKIEQRDIINIDTDIGYTYVRIAMSEEEFHKTCIEMGLTQEVDASYEGENDYIFEDGTEAAIYWPHGSYFYSR